MRDRSWGEVARIGRACAARGAHYTILLAAEQAEMAAAGAPDGRALDAAWFRAFGTTPDSAEDALQDMVDAARAYLTEAELAELLSPPGRREAGSTVV
jgi:hypothetical protein